MFLKRHEYYKRYKSWESAEERMTIYIKGQYGWVAATALAQHAEKAKT